MSAASGAAPPAAADHRVEGPGSGPGPRDLGTLFHPGVAEESSVDMTRARKRPDAALSTMVAGFCAWTSLSSLFDRGAMAARRNATGPFARCPAWIGCSATAGRSTPQSGRPSAGEWRADGAGRGAGSCAGLLAAVRLPQGLAAARAHGGSAANISLPREPPARIIAGIRSLAAEGLFQVAGCQGGGSLLLPPC